MARTPLTNTLLQPQDPPSAVTPPPSPDNKAGGDELVFTLDPAKIEEYKQAAEKELNDPLLMSEFDIKALLVHRRILNDLATTHSGKTSNIIAAHKAFVELVDFLHTVVEKWVEQQKAAGDSKKGRSSDLYADKRSKR